MAVVRLVPSTYYVSSSYLSVSNADRMYTNVDSDTYATITNTYSGTTSYYLYIRGFNFDEIPDSAVINSFTVKFRARESGISTSTSYRPVLASGTSTYSSMTSSGVVGTTVSTITFSGTATFETIKAQGDNFGIRINCRRASRYTTGYMYIYGAEIEVDYTIPDPCTITSTLSGDGTISPGGAYETYKNVEYTLTITPTNKDDAVTATKDGVDITSQLVAHGSEQTEDFVPASCTTSGVQSGSSYAQYAVGHSAESPSTTGTSNNMYASQSSTGYASYSFDFSGIPSNATIDAVEVRCYGHRESSTISSTYVSQCVLYQGGSAISDTVDFPSTSNSIITLTPNTVPSSMSGMTVRHYVGYYGGLVLGITVEVSYSTGEGIDHYTYTYTTDGDATIVVVIGGQGEEPKLYVKQGGSWKEVEKAYKKVNGVWVEQDITTLFNSSENYKTE